MSHNVIADRSWAGIYSGNIYCFPNHPWLLILHFLQVLMFCKTILFYLPAPFRPIFSLPWFGYLEGLQHSFGDFEVVLSCRHGCSAGFSKSLLTEWQLFAVYAEHCILANTWELGCDTCGSWRCKPWAPSHCCGKSSPALLSSVRVPRSSGRNWSREVLPRLPSLSRFNLGSSSAANGRWQTGIGWVFCFVSLFQSVPGDFCSPHLLRIFMKTPTIHPYLIIITEDSWFCIPFLPKLWEKIHSWCSSQILISLADIVTKVFDQQQPHLSLEVLSPSSSFHTAQTCM